MDISELADLMKELNEPSYRAKQIFNWLQQGISSFNEMTDISKGLRQKLSTISYIASANIKKRFESRIDGTVKYLFELYDGELIESVLMKYEHGYTICISTQVGCNL